MKLEIGKRYVTYDGRVTGPLEITTHTTYTFYCSTLRLSWTERGKHEINYNHACHDIISEYTEEKAMFKVGDRVTVAAYTDDVRIVLCLHDIYAWVVNSKGRCDTYITEALVLVPEPKYIRKSVPELMAEGWVFDFHGDLRITKDGEHSIIGSGYLHLLGTENDSRPFDRSVYPHLWKEVK